MKVLLKLNKSIIAIVIFTSLCFVSNYSYAQGLLGKIKNGLAAVVVKKVTDVVKVKERKTGSDTVKTCYSCDHETSTHAFFNTIPKTSEKFVKKIHISNETNRPIIVVISLNDGTSDVEGMFLWFVSEHNEQFGADLYRKIGNDGYFAKSEVTNTQAWKTVNDGGKFVYRIEAYYYFGKPSLEADEKVFISNMYFNGTDLKELDYTVKIVKTPKSDALFAELEKKLQTNKDANDPPTK
jgi:hypothetical protein